MGSMGWMGGIWGRADLGGPARLHVGPFAALVFLLTALLVPVADLQAGVLLWGDVGSWGGSMGSLRGAMGCLWGARGSLWGTTGLYGSYRALWRSIGLYGLYGALRLYRALWGPYGALWSFMGRSVGL